MGLQKERIPNDFLRKKKRHLPHLILEDEHNGNELAVQDQGRARFVHLSPFKALMWCLYAFPGPLFPPGIEHIKILIFLLT